MPATTASTRATMTRATAKTTTQPGREWVAHNRALSRGRQRATSLNLEDAARDLEDGDVEGAAAQVVDGDGLAILGLHSERQRCGGRLVDDPQHVEARDLASILQSAPPPDDRRCRDRAGPGTAGLLGLASVRMPADSGSKFPQQSAAKHRRRLRVCCAFARPCPRCRLHSWTLHCASPKNPGGHAGNGG